LHEAHDFERTTGAGVHDHLEEGHGGDADVLEIFRVATPWSGIIDGFLIGFRVVVESVAMRVDELDGVLEL